MTCAVCLMSMHASCRLALRRHYACADEPAELAELRRREIVKPALFVDALDAQEQPVCPLCCSCFAQHGPSMSDTELAAAADAAGVAGTDAGTGENCLSTLSRLSRTP